MRQRRAEVVEGLRIVGGVLFLHECTRLGTPGRKAVCMGHQWYRHVLITLDPPALITSLALDPQNQRSTTYNKFSVSLLVAGWQFLSDSCRNGWRCCYYSLIAERDTRSHFQIGDHTIDDVPRLSTLLDPVFRREPALAFCRPQSSRLVVTDTCPIPNGKCCCMD
jgi:hypothetical protein